MNTREYLLNSYSTFAFMHSKRILDYRAKVADKRLTYQTRLHYDHGIASSEDMIRRNADRLIKLLEMGERA